MKADLHIHSYYSHDSTSSIEDILRRAAEVGLGCIAIADHNSTDSWQKVQDYQSEIIVIPAVEISTQEGHVIAYGLSKAIPRDMSIADTIAAVHSAGGLACAAHPYRWWSGIGEENVCDEFDLIEAWNARSTRKGNRLAYELALKMKKPVTAGSDSHSLETIGNAYVTITVPCKDYRDVLQALAEGNSVLGGSHRGTLASLRYVVKAIGQWILRGCRRM